MCFGRGNYKEKPLTIIKVLTRFPFFTVYVLFLSTCDIPEQEQAPFELGTTRFNMHMITFFSKPAACFSFAQLLNLHRLMFMIFIENFCTFFFSF